MRLIHTAKNKSKNDEKKLSTTPTSNTTTSQSQQKQSFARHTISDYWESRLQENFGLHGAGFIGLGRERRRHRLALFPKSFEELEGSLLLIF
jgi:hypothetical protein